MKKEWFTKQMLLLSLLCFSLCPLTSSKYPKYDPKYHIQMLPCWLSRDKLNLWWVNVVDENREDVCERRDGTKELCGFCGRETFDWIFSDTKRKDPRCLHSVHRDRYLMYKVHPKFELQHCVHINNCEVSAWYKITGLLPPDCHNRGVCKPRFTNYDCECEKPYVGVDCQHAANSGQENLYATGIDVLIDSHVRVTEKITIIVPIKNPGQAILVEIVGRWYGYDGRWWPGQDKRIITKPRVTDLTSTKLVSFCKKQTSLTDMCDLINGFKFVFATELRFPLIRNLDKTNYYLSKSQTDYPIGYLGDIVVNVYNTVGVSTLVYSKEVQVFVEFPIDITCYRNIEIQNCPRDDGIIRLAPMNEIQLKGIFPNTKLQSEPISLTCFPQIEPSRWKLWQQLPDGSLKATKLTGKGDSFIIKPFELVENIYKVEYSYAMMTQYDRRENFAMCTLEVKEVPIIAKIKGGSKISVNAEGITTLDGSDSMDPNLKEGLNKKGLLFAWQCTSTEVPNPCTNLKYYLSKSQSVIKIPPLKLKLGEQYNITLTVSKKGKLPAYDHQTITVGTGPLVALSVECEEGCYYDYHDQILYGNTKYYIYLRANLELLGKDLKTTDSFMYDWFYAECNTNYNSVENIRVKGSSETLLKIGKNKLQGGKKYCFLVKIQKSDISAELDFSTQKVYEPYNCTIDPKEGITGLTLFKFICCILVKPSTGIVVYEVYDKSENEVQDIETMYSGRMIDSKEICEEIKSFRLVQGNVVAYVYNQYKFIQEYTLRVKLRDFDGIIKDVKQIAKFRSFVKQGLLSSILNTASVVPVILLHGMDRSHYLRYLVFYVRQVQLDMLRDAEASNMLVRDIKLCLSTIQFVLQVMSSNINYTNMSLQGTNNSVQYNEMNFTIEASTHKICADILLTLATELSERVKNIDKEQTLTQNILLQMLNSTLNTVEILISVKNTDVLLKPIYLVDPKLLSLVKQTSRELVNVLYQTSDILLWQQRYDDTASNIFSSRCKITGWVKLDQPKKLHEFLKNNSETELKFSDLFFNLADKITHSMGVQITILFINPYWWIPQKVNTNLLLLQVCKKNLTGGKEFSLVHHNQYFVHFYYDIKEIVNSFNAIEGFAAWVGPNSTRNLKDVDLGVTVYRFDPPQRAKVFIRFIFSNKSEEIRVLFKKNLRPTYSMMMSESFIIGQHSPEYKNLSYEKTDEDKFYYMGVLPHKNIKENHPVKFKMKIYYTQCKTWLQFSWGTWGCWVGDETNDNTLQCDCNHFSLFGGSVQVPPYVLHSATNYFLFLTTDVNWLPLSILITLFSLYLFICIWGRIRDKKDSKNVVILFLNDNYPGERYAYLLAVYTGSRLNSGTSANVGIKIFGDEGESRSHILKSDQRKILKSYSDDWFLLYCPSYLGTVESIQLWHDNSGRNPDWFVEKILVFDLVEKFEYIFEINVWVAFGLNEQPEIAINTSTVEEFFNVKKRFVSNFVVGLRDTHYWTSVLWKHPRNPISRIKRVTVLMCFILVAMSFSLMFYIFYEGENVKEDEPSYFISETEIIICSLTILVALSQSHLTMFLFRKSFSHKHTRKESSLVLRQQDSLQQRMRVIQQKGSSYSSLSESLYSSKVNSFLQLSKKDLKNRFIRYGLRTKLPREKNVFEKMSFAIYSIVRGSSLEPVRLPYYKPTLKTNRFLFVAAWVVCLTVIVISALVVIIFGFRLPLIKSHKWASILTFVIVFDVLVLSTLNVLFSSLFLSFVFQTIVPVTNYQLRPMDEVRKHLVGKVEHLIYILHIRSHPMYCPLTAPLKKYYRDKKIESMKWKILVDFLVLLMLTLVLSELNILSTEDLSLSNIHAEYMLNMLNHDHNKNYIDFIDILNRTHYENFLINSFIYQLFKAMWYNEEPFYIDQREEYWCDDSVLRLLGSVRIRQLRVQQVACSKIKGYEIVTDCSPPWSPNIEDTDVFEIGWTSGDLYDVQRKSKAWRYTRSENSNSSSAYGVTLNFYHSGGYIADIGYKWSPVFEMLALLKSSEWLGHMTRAVFVEITLYNVNTKLFTEVILSAEQMPSGQYLTVTKAESVTTKFTLDLWFILYLIFVIYVFVKLCVLMNRKGFFVYLSKAKNVFEVVLLMLGLSSFALYFVHIQTSSYYVSEFQRRGTFEFFSFLNVNYYVFTMKLVLYTLFICVFVRLLFSWRFGRIYYTFYYTVLLSLSWTLWTFACFIIFLVVFWRLIGYLINAFIFNYFTIIIKFYRDVEGQSAVIQAMTYMMCLISFSVFLLFVSSFSYYYKVAKVYKLIKTDTFNFVIFLRNKFKTTCKRRNI